MSGEREAPAAEKGPSVNSPHPSNAGYPRGLGLSIVQAIVHRHGGHLTAGNADAGGARFEIILPDSDLTVPDVEISQAALSRGALTAGLADVK